MSRIEKRAVGSGLTQDTEERLVFDGSPNSRADIERLGQSLAAAAKRNTPWGWLERERARAERILSAIEAGERWDKGNGFSSPTKVSAGMPARL